MRTSKESVDRRLKIIKGQLNGLEKMVAEDKYCLDVLHLSLSIQRALKEMDQLILEDHMKSCVVEAARVGKADKASKELSDLFKVIRK
jgi:DNA-binding FrmR family transcriptional regulator